MKMSVACAKGCGHTIEVDEQTINNAALLGTQLVFEHDVCPGDDPVPTAATSVERRFRLQLIAMEITGDEPDPTTDYVAELPGVEIVAGLGEVFTGTNFAEVVNGPMTSWLSTSWQRFQETAAFADLPGASTTPQG
ncbi:hypothetical protein [Phycicoccus sp.]|uniref:hypothetical protein n=1 Tax=Phycicoccus sp. TaxID=1902410 RepID=UPI002BF06B05|nr:hypothetical protein [Phycicoccus sp.]HMM95384.1 hypothetical protein [Phycicoccus sp.]